MSKAVRSLSESEVHNALTTDHLRMHRSRDLLDVIAENPITISFSLLAIVAVLTISLMGMFVYHRRANKSAAELAKNSRMWKLLIDSLPIHIFAKDGSHNFKYVFNNKARGEFYGVDAEKINQMDDFNLLPKSDAQARRDADIKLCKAGRGSDEVIVHVKDKNGNLRHLYSQFVPFIDDGTRLLLGCSVDQTELADARMRAEENAERFQKTLISIGDGVLTTDTKGCITLLNPVAEKMLGVTLDECKGKPHTDYFNIVSYLDESPVPSPVERCLRAGEIVTLANHTDLISKNGTRYHIADSAAPIRAVNGKIAGAILVFRDVTQEYDLRDKLETSANQLLDALNQAQHASAAKGVFLSQMSHEIRTPLNAVIGYLSIAKESIHDTEKVRDCLVKGSDASAYLLSIINDILDISAIESGKLKIANDDFDFKHLLTGIVSMFYNQAEARKIKFEMHLRDLTEEWLMGDSLRLNQILMNLLSNAMKFTPSGGEVTLTVKQLALVHNRVQIMMNVSDTGCGMSAEFKSRLFKPFEQQDASTARRFGGTGLGLSITKNLVTMMGGTIDVESEENKGTSFTVNLSFERSTKVLAVADADFSKLRALVVDDKDGDRDYIKLVLEKCGVKSDSVSSGEEAITQLKKRMDSRHPYDLCLLDQRLSGINGIETARRIREIEGITKDMPIIIVTAYDVSAISAQAHASGVNKIIQKPLFQSTFFDFLMSSYYQISECENTMQVREALKGLTVMLVEDKQMNMDISTQYLERAGMEIVQAWNGKEAVDIFEKSPKGRFAAILMDIQMPIMDGYKATETIRTSSHPDAKSIPIIAMTANAFNEDVVRALSAGMNDHISKPIFYDSLFESISKLTRKK